MTHHAPHRGSLAARFAADMVSAGFVSDLSHLMGRSALWIHGHTHDSFDYSVDGTLVICNPRGYLLRSGDFENRGFDASLVAEVRNV